MKKEFQLLKYDRKENMKLKFYRPAQVEDFERFFNQTGLYRLNDEEKEWIRKDKEIKAIHSFRERTSSTINYAKTIVEQYKIYLKVKKDFEDGKPVFVPY